MNYVNLEKVTMTELRKFIDKESLKEAKQELKKYRNHTLGFDVESGQGDDGYYDNYMDLNINIYYKGKCKESFNVLVIENYPNQDMEKLEKTMTKVGKGLVK